MDQLKWAAIIEYTNGATTGAVVNADSEEDAWSKILKNFDHGRAVHAIRMSMILTPERECL